MVQLDYKVKTIEIPNILFQFHYGSIRFDTPDEYGKDGFIFQFHYGSIRFIKPF